MRILLDTGILGKLCHPSTEQNRGAKDWLKGVLALGTDAVEVYVPEIADYELRRKLRHLALRERRETTPSLERLDYFGEVLEYLALDTPTMRRAAELWAEARHAGRKTAPERDLDGDVILAAQARKVGGVVVTENVAHLSSLVDAYRWDQLGPEELSLGR